MPEVKDYLQPLLPITDREWGALRDRLTPEHYAKQEKVITEGQQCNAIYFIARGCFRFYTIREGNEEVTAFFFADSFMSNYRSFLTGAPSEHYIEALRDSVVYSLQKRDLTTLYDRYKTFERLGRYLAENTYLAITGRLDSLLNSSPEERYRALVSNQSRLLQEIPQYMIASYLGVKPETLSRIRARM